jgi:hypothetical protein
MCTTRFNIHKFYILPTQYMCFIWISEQTAVISLYGINPLGQMYNEVGGGGSGTFGIEERCVQGVGGMTDWKRPLRKPRCRWEHSIKINLQEMGLERCLD